MKFGFGSGAAAGSTVNYEALVAAFSLRHWERADFASSPWNGTASAGTSGSNSLTEATNPPNAVGGTLNGFQPANFDGTNDRLSTAAALSTYYTTTAQYGWALVNIAAIDTNNANWGLNDPIIMSSGTLQWGIILRNASGTITVEHFLEATGPTTRSVTASFSTGTPHLVCWKQNGTTISIKVDSGAWQNNTGGTALSLAAVGAVGWGGSGGAFMNGSMYEIAFTETALSDANFDTVKDYVNQRYALAL